jgi:two-component system response regulator PilR (NtrC family)
MSDGRYGKVLIVDDNDQMSSLLADILELFDYQSRQAKDGEEALKRLEEEKYDLVITDLRMPRMSGTDLLKVIKKSHPGLPVVVVSGYTPGNTQNVIITEQADGFLHKPFTVEQIEKILKGLPAQK